MHKKIIFAYQAMQLLIKLNPMSIDTPEYEIKRLKDSFSKLEKFNIHIDEDELRYVLDSLNCLRHGGRQARPREFNAIERLKEKLETKGTIKAKGKQTSTSKI